MKDLEKYWQEQDRIEDNQRAFTNALRITGARICGQSVIRRLPHGETTIESISDFLDRFPGRIW